MILHTLHQVFAAVGESCLKQKPCRESPGGSPASYKTETQFHISAAMSLLQHLPRHTL